MQIVEADFGIAVAEVGMSWQYFGPDIGLLGQIERLLAVSRFSALGCCPK